MNTPGENSASTIDESVEEILGNARPRPVPSMDDAAVVREQVHAEWQKLTKRRQTKKRLLSFAIAASVLVAAFATFSVLRINGVTETYVASIDRNVGSVYVLGENSELLASNNLTSIVAGQILITNEDSGVGLEWGTGGSLRIDENSRVEFVARDAIFLHSGRVYFDSNIATSVSGQQETAAKLTIDTEHGEVSHVGTQYMTAIDRNSLTVSVREGEVEIRSGAIISSANGGEQLHLQRGNRPNNTSIQTYGDYWQWTERVTPSPNLNGRSIDDFLSWVGHETGQIVRYETAEAERYAVGQSFVGTVNERPSDALRIWMMSVDLDWDADDGAIVVRKSGPETE